MALAAPDFCALIDLAVYERRKGGDTRTVVREAEVKHGRKWCTLLRDGYEDIVYVQNVDSFHAMLRDDGTVVDLGGMKAYQVETRREGKDYGRVGVCANRISNSKGENCEPAVNTQVSSGAELILAADPNVECAVFRAAVEKTFGPEFEPIAAPGFCYLVEPGIGFRSRSGPPRTAARRGSGTRIRTRPSKTTNRRRPAGIPESRSARRTTASSRFTSRRSGISTPMGMSGC